MTGAGTAVLTGPLAPSHVRRLPFVQVYRFASDEEATLSWVRLIWPDGRIEHLCEGLEDEYRAEKVAGETRIPAGRYRLTLRTVGGFHARYSQRFADIHKGMIWVRDVPGFDYILIHVGNKEADTAGCLLVGNADDTNRMWVGESAATYRKIYRRLADLMARGMLSEIEYVDGDR
jgi:hypothetical protein